MSTHTDSRQPAEATRKPRLLFLSDLAFQYGAGIAQARQVQSFLEAGWAVGVLAWEPGGVGIEEILTRPVVNGQWLGLRRIRQLEQANGYNNDEIIAGLVLEVARFRPDVVIAGNLHAPGWPLQLLPALRESGCRVITYLHDGYYFSGRCAYPGDCTLYLTGCDERCPTHTEYPALAPEKIRHQWQLRRILFNGPDGVEAVANSDWTRDKFRAALPEARSCVSLHLGADEKVFLPGDKAEARRQLGLPLDATIVLCAAVNFDEKRKGGPQLLGVVNALKDDVTFAAFGHNTQAVPGLIGLGYHTNQWALAQIYQAADLYLGTAIEEAFGQTVMEAHLCGLPVVAFQVGGVSEIIRNEITGKLVRAGNTGEAVAAIRQLTGDQGLRDNMGRWARLHASSRFTIEAQAKAWEAYLAGIRPGGTGLNPPTLSYELTPNDVYRTHRPSWPCDSDYVNNEHAAVYQATSDLPGWQMPGDSEKLYEMGYHAGDVILEIGTYGGRSAAVELRGALANPVRGAPPQFYGVDISPESIARTRQTLIDQGLASYCHLFEGTFQEFITRWQIRPTMVFLDGDHRYAGVKADMVTLGHYLPSGVPILVHDFLNPENDAGDYGVRQAALEWIAEGRVKLAGCFGCSALLVTQDPGA